MTQAGAHEVACLYHQLRSWNREGATTICLTKLHFYTNCLMNWHREGATTTRLTKLNIYNTNCLRSWQREGATTTHFRRLCITSTHGLMMEEAITCLLGQFFQSVSCTMMTCSSFTNSNKGSWNVSTHQCGQDKCSIFWHVPLLFGNHFFLTKGEASSVSDITILCQLHLLFPPFPGR